MIVLNTLFGASAGLDAFVAAFRVPNLLRDLLAEGALSQAFTSVLAKRKQEQGDESAWNLIRKLGTQIFLLMLVIVTLGIIFAGPIISLMFHARPDDVGFATEMSRIMWPFIAFISFAALVMGVLNVLGSFALPMLASCAFNVTAVILGLVFGWLFDPTFGPRSLLGFSIGVTLGGAAQWLVQCPTLRKSGFRFHFDFNWKDKGIIAIWSLMLPAALASGVTQINIFINSIFALELAEGSVTALENAFRLLQLPVGLFGVATGMIVLPDISRLAAKSNTGEVSEKLALALRQVCFFALPSFIILFFLSEEVVSVMFQRGKFTPESVALSASALKTYALGLFGYAGIKIVQPAFIALEKKWVPLGISLIAFGISVGLNYTFVRILHKDDCSWLSLTTSVITTLNFLAYFLILRIFLGSLKINIILKGLFRMIIAAIAMALVCLLLKEGIYYFLQDNTSLPITGNPFLHWSFWTRISILCLIGGASGGIYLATAALTRTPEMTTLLGYIKKRFFNKRG